MIDNPDLISEIKLLNNFLSRRNQSAIQSSISKIIKNPNRSLYRFKVFISNSQLFKELRVSLSNIATSYQNETMPSDIVSKSLMLAKAIDCDIKVGKLTPVCMMCHSLCDPYAKKVQCCNYFAHTPCLEQITGPNGKFNCVKCQKPQTLNIEVVCQNCRKTVMPDKTMVSACRHIICIDCVAAAQPLLPSPYCFCCPLSGKSGIKLNLQDIPVM